MGYGRSNEASQGALVATDDTSWTFGTREPTKSRRRLWVATDTFVLVYSQLEQNDLLLFHVEKNSLLNGLLDTTYTRDI